MRISALLLFTAQCPCSVRVKHIALWSLLHWKWTAVKLQFGLWANVVFWGACSYIFSMTHYATSMLVNTASSAYSGKLHIKGLRVQLWCKLWWVTFHKEKMWWRTVVRVIKSSHHRITTIQLHPTLQILYLCGHPTIVDYFLRVHSVSLLWTACYFGHFLPSPLQVSRLQFDQQKNAGTLLKITQLILKIFAIISYCREPSAEGPRKYDGVRTVQWKWLDKIFNYYT